VVLISRFKLFFVKFNVKFLYLENYVKFVEHHKKF